jgi:hypothetical protein
LTLFLFLNILGLCIGFISALFFSSGALSMSPSKIQRIATSYWDANQHWGDSLADQRSDYIVGAFLLLLSFTAQLLANIVSPTAEPAVLQPLGCAVAEIAAALTMLLMSSIILRNLIAKRTKSQVRKIQAEAIAAEKRRKS